MRWALISVGRRNPQGQVLDQHRANSGLGSEHAAGDLAGGAAGVRILLTPSDVELAVIPANLIRSDYVFMRVSTCVHPSFIVGS
jgi:hypothetical protein